MTYRGTRSDAMDVLPVGSLILSLSSAHRSLPISEPYETRLVWAIVSRLMRIPTCRQVYPLSNLYTYNKPVFRHLSGLCRYIPSADRAIPPLHISCRRFYTQDRYSIRLISDWEIIIFHISVGVLFILCLILMPSSPNTCYPGGLRPLGRSYTRLCILF